jgi:hypothetical protein
VNVVAADKVRASEPLVACDPLQPPLAVQAVASVDDQLSVEVWPGETLVGLAESETVGGVGAVTVTVAALSAVPPGPVHVSVNTEVVDSDRVSVPLVASDPLQPPLAVHAVALADDHVKVDDSPAAMLVGFADSETVGVGSTTAPVDTTRFTAVPGATDCPAAGF